MKKTLLLALTVLLTNFTAAQDCGCSDTFTWLKKTFEENDAGFQYAIDQKGEAEYKKITEYTAEKVKTIKDKPECANTLFNCLKFFRKGYMDRCK